MPKRKKAKAVVKHKTAGKGKKGHAVKSRKVKKAKVAGVARIHANVQAIERKISAAIHGAARQVTKELATGEKAVKVIKAKIAKAKTKVTKIEAKIAKAKKPSKQSAKVLKAAQNIAHSLEKEISVAEHALSAARASEEKLTNLVKHAAQKVKAKVAKIKKEKAAPSAKPKKARKAKKAVAAPASETPVNPFSGSDSFSSSNNPGSSSF